MRQLKFHLVWVIFALALLGTMPGFGGPALRPGPLRGSGKLISVGRELAGFRQIQVSHGCRAEVSQAAGFDLKFKIDENLKDFLDIRQEGTLLIIGLKDYYTYAEHNFQARVLCPDIDTLEASGNSRVNMENFDLSHKISLSLSGASSLRGSLKTPSMEIALSGGSRIALRGKGETLRLTASGASKAELDRFPVSEVGVFLSGDSSATLHATGSIEGNITGASVLSYGNQPRRIEVEKSGGARIEKK